MICKSYSIINDRICHIALFLMPEHPLQWMIHSDTKAISNTFNKISLSFPASPKDVVGLRANALITFQIHIIPRGLQPFNWRSNDFKCLIPSFLFKYLSLFLSLSVHRLYTCVCVCVPWSKRGIWLVMVVHPTMGIPAIHGPMENPYGLMTNPNQWSVIRLCQVETSAQQIEMVPALNTGGLEREGWKIER